MVQGRRNADARILFLRGGVIVGLYLGVLAFLSVDTLYTKMCIGTPRYTCRTNKLSGTEFRVTEQCLYIHFDHGEHSVLVTYTALKLRLFD